MHVARSRNKAHKGAFNKQRGASLHALFPCAGEQSMHQSRPWSGKGGFVAFLPYVNHMCVMHVVLTCVAGCPQCELNNYIIELHIHLQGLVCGYFTASPIVTISPLSTLLIYIHRTSPKDVLWDIPHHVGAHNRVKMEFPGMAKIRCF
jgi:hypothetical protein